MTDKSREISKIEDPNSICCQWIKNRHIKSFSKKKPDANINQSTNVKEIHDALI